MAKVKYPYGKPVKLLVELQGYPDGRLLFFEVWCRKGGNEEKIAEVSGVTKYQKGVGLWNPEFKIEESLQLQKKLEQTDETEEFFFVARIDNQEAKPEDTIIFTYPLDIFMVDTQGVPLDNVECTVTFSDSSKKNGRFAAGHLKINDAPAGKFSVELKGAKFIYNPAQSA